MKDSNTTQVRITEGSSDSSSSNDVQENRKLQLEELKKPLIYFLMTIVFVGCLYLIFKPKEKTTIEDVGFNSVIPQAADDQLQSDKQKAYEQQLLENKNDEKRNALTTLSDYWTDPATSKDGNMESVHAQSPTNPNSNILQGDHNAVNSYRNAQQTLGSFYSRDDQEVSQLKREISRLKNESSQNVSSPTGTTINDQLELMEKSYQMAAKYLPTSANQEKSEEKQLPEKDAEQKKVQVTAAQSVRKNLVSSIYREVSDSTLLTGLEKNRFNGLQNEHETTSFQNQNSIQAVIHETKTISSESMVSLRLSQPMMLGKMFIPAGTLVKASGKFQGGRLQLKISTIEYKGNIQQVEINIHDNDGQLGLNIPYSPEQNAVTEILGNMGQTSGTNIMMTQSAGQQIAADLTKGVVQGISGYFQKKVRLPKVTIKAGHQVFLVSKNN
ncbi:conjugative transposon protein TraM [Chryseobacterium chendengshani]|uniref:conjugative transposon protein TraM n=1 Tax=Chryseobacterium sp. LJ668 TaxID=2864040 RepID=UPI001C68F42C|nr:conjugative transposon protein TraM [Chryseobacterium sp. LJ668]MBW8523800.1 conjugative transposon protein TraM [Chryseobacterium sp. LJ668]QYK16743.1 conjugative transposon protein TraM [Chryseobacterium sp. LJ668]